MHGVFPNDPHRLLYVGEFSRQIAPHDRYLARYKPQRYDLSLKQTRNERILGFYFIVPNFLLTFAPCNADITLFL